VKVPWRRFVGSSCCVKDVGVGWPCEVQMVLEVP
jgi:hypothetical protein